MKAIQHKHRKLIAASVLFAFVMAWVLPVQACFASTGAVATHCQNCTSPAGCDGMSCGTSMSATCASHLAPAVAGQHSTPDFAFIPVAITVIVPKISQPHFTPAVLTPAASSIPVNIRFCSFQN
jgi:hypothetical protein